MNQTDRDEIDEVLKEANFMIRELEKLMNRIERKQNGERWGTVMIPNGLVLLAVEDGKYIKTINVDPIVIRSLIKGNKILLEYIGWDAQSGVLSSSTKPGEVMTRGNANSSQRNPRAGTLNISLAEDIDDPHNEGFLLYTPASARRYQGVHDGQACKAVNCPGGNYVRHEHTSNPYLVAGGLIPIQGFYLACDRCGYAPITEAGKRAIAKKGIKS